MVFPYDSKFCHCPFLRKVTFIDIVCVYCSLIGHKLLGFFGKVGRKAREMFYIFYVLGLASIFFKIAQRLALFAS